MTKRTLHRRRADAVTTASSSSATVLRIPAPLTWSATSLSDSTMGQALRFCIVGALGTLVNLSACQGLLAIADAAPETAAVAGFLVAVTFNHLLNREWTFGARNARYLSQGARFFAISLVALGIDLAVLRTSLGAGLAFIPAQLLGILAATPASFVGNRAWTFRGQS